MADRDEHIALPAFLREKPLSVLSTPSLFLPVTIRYPPVTTFLHSACASAIVAAHLE
jgi:hypothetical protein